MEDPIDISLRKPAMLFICMICFISSISLSTKPHKMVHKPINQQVVVIIGASSGIGKVTAMEFGAKGAKLVIADRSRAGLEATSSEIMSRGGQVVWMVADVSSIDNVSNTKIFLDFYRYQY